MYLEKQQDYITRGHILKFVNNRYHYDLRKFSFAPRIVNVWNSLPEIVISAATTDTFKIRLDKFWQHQAVSLKHDGTDGSDGSDGTGIQSVSPVPSASAAGPSVPSVSNSCSN